MFVPQYWAESREQTRQKGRQITVRRFGWSDISQADAEALAGARARDAMHRLLAGEKLPRREPKVPYNGADGFPIREEIVSRHGDTIVTRNSYGARCLNTPNVLFADIDFSDGYPAWSSLAMLPPVLLGAVTAKWLALPLLALVIVIILIAIVAYVGVDTWRRTYAKLRVDEGRAAHDRIAGFVADHPAWNLRVYRSPAGLRVMVTHQTFEPRDPAVAAFFDALLVDPMYRQMCMNQNCFRARVSAKPWRIGIAAKLRPSPGVWPIAPSRLPERQAWVAHYESIARNYAACRLLATLGSGFTSPAVQAVQDLHDQMSCATTELPIA